MAKIEKEISNIVAQINNYHSSLRVLESKLESRATQYLPFYDHGLRCDFDADGSLCLFIEIPSEDLEGNKIDLSIFDSPEIIIDASDFFEAVPESGKYSIEELLLMNRA